MRDDFEHLYSYSIPSSKQDHSKGESVMRKIVGLAAVLVLTSLATVEASHLEYCLATCSNGGPGYQGGAPSYYDCCTYFNMYCGSNGTAYWIPIDGPMVQCPSN